MTKEELEKKATAYALKWGDKTDGTYACCRDGYLAGAKTREKNVKSLGKRCLQLQKDKGNLTDRVSDLEEKLANADYQLEGRDNEIRELKDEVRKLKLLVSSLVYEINQIWDINEMNDDLRMCAEKIDREVQLSKMAEDNRNTYYA